MKRYLRVVALMFICGFVLFLVAGALLEYGGIVSAVVVSFAGLVLIFWHLFNLLLRRPRVKESVLGTMGFVVGGVVCVVVILLYWPQVSPWV